MVRATCLILTLVLLGGCAVDNTHPVLSEDHPAHPKAASTPPPPPSGTLNIADDDRHDDAPADTEAQPTDHGGHSGMDHGDDGETEPGPAAQEDTEQTVYVCPMHPEVTSNDPQARCPKCGMALERKEHSNDQ